MEEIFSPADRARLDGLVQVQWGRDEPMPLDAFQAAVPTATAVVCAKWRYGDALYEAERLRAILEVSGGFDIAPGFDFDYCFDRRIRVLSVAPAFARQVAEMALAMALAATRDICREDRAFRDRTERYLWAGNVDTFMLFGKTVGLIGYGNLARALRPLLEPFGCTYLVYDPWLSPGYLHRQDLQAVPLEELLARSDVVFVLAAPTVENRALLSRQMLERIQAHAVLVLISRAHVADFDALTELVLAGRFRAAIDVFPVEPLPQDHPIRRADNAVLSGHRAGSVREGLWEIGEMVVDDLEAIIRGLPPRRLQNAEPELCSRYASGAVPRSSDEETAQER
jgi:phosphoglycerate dehydrogenase-like enzyme